MGVRCRQELPGDTVAKVDELTPELEERRAALASKPEDMQAASDDEWESFKTDPQEKLPKIWNKPSATCRIHSNKPPHGQIKGGLIC